MINFTTTSRKIFINVVIKLIFFKHTTFFFLTTQLPYYCKISTNFSFQKLEILLSLYLNSCVDVGLQQTCCDRDLNQDNKIDRRSDHSRLIGDRIGDQKKFIRSDHF